MRRLIAGCLLGFVLLGAAATPAGAAVKVKTKIVGVTATDFAPADGVWDFVEGELSSKKAKCERDREIVIKHASTKGGNYQVFGTDTTDSDGLFEVSGAAPAKDHFKIVAKKSKAGKVVCLAGKVAGFF